jgi:hypothetical protein
MKTRIVTSIVIFILTVASFMLMHLHFDHTCALPPVTPPWSDGLHCSPNGMLYERTTKVMPDTGLILYHEALVFDYDNTPIGTPHDCRRHI